MNLRKLLIGLVSVGLAACKPSGEHGHDHGDDHGHDHGAEEPEPIAITRWTDRYELFVEFPPPAPNAKVRYHAHVTRLAGFQAVEVGRFSVRFKRDSQVVAESSVDKVARPGIFTPEGNAPPAGTYTLEMAYEHDGQSDTFDCGSIEIPNKPAAEEATAGAITFLKEAQWKIPFATAWSEERDLAPALELPGTVEPAGNDQLTLGAPTSGRFFHSDRNPLAAGKQVKKGEVIGTIAPNVEGEDFSRLEAAVDESALKKRQLEAELERVKPLVQQGLLPEKRQIEITNEIAAESAQLSAAQRRLGRVTAPGGQGGLPIRATMDGVIQEVLVPNGEPVQAGAVLVRLAGSGSLWLRTRFVARPAGELVDAAPVLVRTSDGERLDVEGRARFLSAQPVVDPRTRLAAWVVELTPKEGAGDENLRPGAAVVVTVRAGKPHRATAVPRSAIVEISTRPYVFVQPEGESFLKRLVTLGISDGRYVEIKSGLDPRERVVTEGGFDVHVASLSGTVESHRH